MANWNNEWSNLNTINNNNQFTNNDVPTADTFNKTINNVGYLKNAVDDTYTKSQVDTFLNAKANQSTTYTKTETDTFLNAKANASDVYTKTEIDETLDNIYTKSTVNNLLDGKVNKSAFSGNYFPESRVYGSISSAGLYAISFHLSTDTTKIFTCLLNIYNTSSKFSTFVVCSSYRSSLGITTVEIIYDNGTITTDVKHGGMSSITANIDRTYKIANIS